ncbi:uncharacterized protein FFUJ_12793 [Fusarium fujikuroi IMI 58289]|uniref:Chromo domain-containing protein n=1 Tax=Gibberella fujikuroi (strain CBS 195.34 / IMI 58289 / NRRL A-6831) TaxID=1279085 RepID=S0EGE3_GIBF5|nr:uncharacterized protein FFUJ_12793 [Fusarium fujikuroi IMI 58289]CCT72897.1 uncharacterized protein FFUJ_12793 [Fusarium fujikuroi IMI 58289]SCO24994.1 uncharacterized protein FFM5_13909 [Fusarium fujikuroi]
MSFYQTTSNYGATTRSSSMNEAIVNISDSESTTSTGSEDTGSLGEEPATKEQLTYWRLSSIGKGDSYSLKTIGNTSYALVRSIHSVWFTAEWDDGAESWEPEVSLQGYQPELVYAYWDAIEGGRQGATKFDLFHVFRILEHRTMRDSSRRRAKKLCYKVQWVGYDVKDYSWEPAAKVALLVPWMKKEYDKMHGL